MNLNVKKLHPEAKLPSKGHPGDAGIDFFAVETAIFAPDAQVNVKTGVAVEIPEGHVGLIWDKSSISFNKGLKVMGGVIDAGYRGEIIMSLYNTSSTEQIIEKGSKIAQMIIQKFEDCEIKEVFEVSETVRGEGREGSTGQK
jgi:dUTP pyrophosphatase